MYVCNQEDWFIPESYSIGGLVNGQNNIFHAIRKIIIDFINEIDITFTNASKII
jgi:hypothetical protein